MSRALVLLNLGTPKSPAPDDVGTYLKEFLMDGAVVDIPKFLRWFLVNVIIVPRRKFKSAEAYQKIWDKNGSPLMSNSSDLTAKVAEFQGGGTTKLAMRYGEPSIKAVVAELKKSGVDEIDFVPLYPQYALSSTETAIERLREVIKEFNWSGSVRVLKPFYDHPVYIEQLAKNYRQTVAGFNPDFTLMSYHGLPRRHLTKVHSSCLTTGCCDSPSERSDTCYRYQSYATSRALAKALGLKDGQWSVSFQSRLGPGWIEPFTDKEFVELAAKGVKKLVVLSPSFVCDCLETLEEIQVRGQELFVHAGGHELRLVPALNADPMWAKAIAESPNNEKLWSKL